MTAIGIAAIIALSVVVLVLALLVCALTLPPRPDDAPSIIWRRNPPRNGGGSRAA